MIDMSNELMERKTEELHAQHAAFVNFYLGDAGYNGTAAARMAGYRIPHMSAWELMQRDDVKYAIKQRTSTSAMYTDELLMRLGHEARGIGDYLEVDDDGHTKVNVRKLKRDGKGSLIVGLKSNKYGQTIEFVDPLAAQALLVKVHNLAPESTAVDLAVAEASKLKAMAELVRLGVAIGKASAESAAPIAVSGTTDVVIESSAVLGDDAPDDLVSRVPLHDAPGSATNPASLGVCQVCGEKPASKVTKGGARVCTVCIP